MGGSLGIGWHLHRGFGTVGSPLMAVLLGACHVGHGRKQGKVTAAQEHTHSSLASFSFLLIPKTWQKVHFWTNCTSPALNINDICRRSKAKCGDVCSVWFASNADSGTDAHFVQCTSACTMMCTRLWHGGGGKHQLTVHHNKFQAACTRELVGVLNACRSYQSYGYRVLPGCAVVVENNLAVLQSWSLSDGFYNIFILAVEYCKRNFQPKLWVLFLDILML